jgi:hypothetical protein
MRTPYGLTILDNCLVCPKREEHLFCNLPPAGAEAPKLIRVEVRYDNEKLKAFLKQPAKKITDGGMLWVELAGAHLKGLDIPPQPQVINSDPHYPPHGVKVPTRLRPRLDN